jgi:hypothetical protein
LDGGEVERKAGTLADHRHEGQLSTAIAFPEWMDGVELGKELRRVMDELFTIFGCE